MTVLGVFFTRGVSLVKWHDAGLFDREVLLYREHLRSGALNRIYWFTYGSDDGELARRLVSEGRLPAEVHIVPWSGWLDWCGRAGSPIYSLLMPWLARKHLQRCDLFKTNQMDGAIAAVVSSLLWKRPLYVRTGYTLSLFVDKIFARNLVRRCMAWLTEFLAFRYSEISSVSSRFDLEYVRRRYRPRDGKLVIVGNYIDTDAFSPTKDIEKSNRLVFVGRISPQKNLEMAIRACSRVGIGFDIIGDGEQRKHLESVAMEVSADVRWLGIVANEQLPATLKRYRYFILPSLWEGMPKALLEAMASGLVCIGNNARGISEVIEDGVTGYLASGPSAPELAEAIQRAIRGNQDAVSSAGRDLVCRQFSLRAIAEKEVAILSGLLSTKMGCRRGGRA